MKFEDTDYLVDERQKFQCWIPPNESGKISSCHIDLINEKLTEWSELNYKISDLGLSYRDASYLKETNLLIRKGPEFGGWQKLSYVECIYVLTVMALKSFGVKTSLILPFADGVLNDFYNGGWKWFFPIFGIHVCGIEMELFFSASGYCNLLGSELAVRHYEGFEDGEIRIRLSSIVNKLRKRVGLDPVKLDKKLSLLPLGRDETAVIHEMRDLHPGRGTVNIRKTPDGDTLVTGERQEDVSSELAKQIGSLVDESYGSVEIKKRDDKLVAIKKTKITKY